MRLIDADALIDEMESHNVFASGSLTIEEARAKCEIRNILIEDVRNAPTVVDWVSVKDRLAIIGRATVLMVLAYGICKLIDLFERVGRLEVNDDVRRNDVIDVRSQIECIKEKL